MDIIDSSPTCRACGELLGLDADFCLICGRLFCRRHLMVRKGVPTCAECEPERVEREAAGAATAADEERIVRLLTQDLLTTVGQGFDAMIVEAAARSRLFRETLESYEHQVIDDVQQCIHDEFVDTAWPACPLHKNHPLWYSEGWWRCPHAGAIARLGELGSKS